MLATSTGYDVLIALIAAVPSLVAVVLAAVVTMRTRMPNGTKLGQTVSDAYQTVNENNALLRKLNGSESAGES